jgi:hypothetical protein
MLVASPVGEAAEGRFGIEVRTRPAPTRRSAALRPGARKATPRLLRRIAIEIGQMHGPATSASISAQADVQVVVGGEVSPRFLWLRKPLPWGTRARLQTAPNFEGPNVYLRAAGKRQAGSLKEQSIELSVAPVELVQERSLELRAITEWEPGARLRSTALFRLSWDPSSPPTLLAEIELMRRIGAIVDTEQNALIRHLPTQMTEDGVHYLRGQRLERGAPTIAMDLVRGTTILVVDLPPVSVRTLEVSGGSLQLRLGNDLSVDGEL